MRAGRMEMSHTPADEQKCSPTIAGFRKPGVRREFRRYA
jgi:hypothetical protein